MSSDPSTRPGTAYRLDDQIGFLLRQVAQRHAALFAAGMENAVTATQWAALSKLAEVGPVGQNRLGRLTVMDAATIKGVVDRLVQRGLVGGSPDPDDGRRRLAFLTPAGEDFVRRMTAQATQVTTDTLAPLTPAERERLTALLLKLR